MNNENFEVVSEKEVTNTDVINDTLYYRDGIGADTCKMKVKVLVSEGTKIAQFFFCDNNGTLLILRSIVVSTETPDDIFDKLINNSIDEFMNEYEDSFNDMTEKYWLYDYYYIYTANGILSMESTYGHKSTTEEIFYNFESSGEETINTNNSISIYCDRTISVHAPEFSIISIDTKNVKSTEYQNESVE
jgi:hypothetical protein